MLFTGGYQSIPASADKQQLERLLNFRHELQPTGYYWRFSSRDQFRRDFSRHLSLKMNSFQKGKPTHEPTRPTQVITGDNNVQAGRDVNVYTRTPKIKKVVPRPEGSVSSQELWQIKQWINELAEGEIGTNRGSAYAKWGAIFLNTFKLNKREELLSDQMAEVQAWFIQQRAIQTRGQKTKAPEEWRKKRIGAIKAAMNQMGATNETYYPELSRRLRMKKTFVSLKDLTKRDLDRVYRMVLADGRGF